MSNGVRATLSNSISGITFLMFLGVASIQDILAMQPSPSSSSWLLATNKQLWALGKQTTSAHILPSWSGQMWGCVIPGPLPLPPPEHEAPRMLQEMKAFTFPSRACGRGWAELKASLFYNCHQTPPGAPCSVATGAARRVIPCLLSSSRWLNTELESDHCDVRTSHMCPF